MNKKAITELKKLVKESEGLSDGMDYLDTEEYKNIDQIYMSNKNGTVDVLYNIAIDTNLQNIWDHENVMLILHSLLLQHKDEYLKSKYKDMIKIVFENPTLVQCRIFLPDLLSAGFTDFESEEMLRKYLKTEQDPINIKHFKFKILWFELLRRFPEQKGFLFVTSMLELNEPDQYTVEKIQKYIDNEVKEHDADIVQKYIKAFLNYEYTKESSKNILMQIRVDGDYK